MASVRSNVLIKNLFPARAIGSATSLRVERLFLKRDTQWNSQECNEVYQFWRGECKYQDCYLQKRTVFHRYDTPLGVLEQGSLSSECSQLMRKTWFDTG